MKFSNLESALVAAALLLCANLSFAAGVKPGAPTDIKPITAPKAADGKAKDAKPAKAAKKIKLVDINSAGKAELKKLPGIGDAEADKIIAGRPYLTKAQLVTQNILPAMVYEGLKNQVMAKPNKATEAKLNEMQKKH